MFYHKDAIKSQNQNMSCFTVDSTARIKLLTISKLASKLVLTETQLLRILLIMEYLNHSENQVFVFKSRKLSLIQLTSKKKFSESKSKLSKQL